MASLTSTSGGKIPVDSTVTAQRHTSQHSHEAASASMPLSLTFPYIPLQQARSSQPEAAAFASRKHQQIQSQSKIPNPTAF